MRIDDRKAGVPVGAPIPRIPFNRPTLVGGELEAVQSAILSGHIAGDGPFTRRCAELLETSVGCERALLTTSCTHALEMAALLLDLRPGDEVIVPAFTFVSTANAFVLRGATPRFADIRPDTLNIDPAHVEQLITERTRAIVVVHYAGVACDMDAIMRLAEKAGISVVEDNAHGLYGTFRGRQLGTFGTFATQSFHETKNFTCGEGGALLLNDRSLVDSAEIIREKGTNRSRFFRGQVDKYTWVDIGSSYLSSDILAAQLCVQLEKRDTIQRLRATIWQNYIGTLCDWANRQGIHTPTVPSECGQAFHMFYLLLPSLENRQRFIAHLRERQILAVFHYMPLHISPMGERFGGRIGACPITESVSDRLVRLPFFTGMSVVEQTEVIEAALSFTV
jgi:dTDP-4-amino-4,6-dideoxygalactose transaminase